MPPGPAPVLSGPVPRWIPELGDPRLPEGWARRAAPPRTMANRKVNYFAKSFLTHKSEVDSRCLQVSNGFLLHLESIQAVSLPWPLPSSLTLTPTHP